MKRIISILILCVSSLVSGCSGKSFEQESMYEIIESRSMPSRTGNFYIVYSKDTGVMYHLSPYGILTPLLNPDGTPQIYEED